MSDWPNIDQLINMAKHQPEALEAFRQKEINALITSAPKEMQRRLQGLQFKIDCQRELHKTPMGTCVAISNMMHDSMLQLNELLNNENAHTTSTQSATNSHTPAAGQLIPFPA
ncbi:DUF3135 domain-containing protein [Teredinibacter purpureus]|jgi:Protein of unknown function (DUF3135).|uniref:DUF3135 domain-containing protein n=1 Tax=Teredinibacter purpureus TaxID=2731756 RepID=UPI0005F8708D|nr:DUF3135 domain-containing protein [Teredinibacter purpureus]